MEKLKLQDLLPPVHDITQPPANSLEEKLKGDIQDFKQLALDYVKDTLKNEKSLEIKEVKDLVSIVDTIEKSLIKEKPIDDKTVNVLIQNLMNKNSDDL